MGRTDRPRKIWIGIAPVLSGGLYAVSFPSFSLWPLAWIALVPVLTVILGTSSRHIFARAWLTGLVAFFSSFFWVRRTMIDYGGIPVAASLFFLLLLAAYCAIYVGAALSVGVFIKRKLALSGIVVIPATWVAAEYLRGHLLTGFPWNGLGQSQYPWLHILQNADWGSYYGISWMILMVNVLIAEWILSRHGSLRRKIELGLVSAGMISAVVYGAYRLHQPVTGPEYRIGLIQGNVAQDVKWDIDFREEMLLRHLELTAQTAREGMDFAVWPESALTFHFRYGWRYPGSDGEPLGLKLQAFVDSFQAAIITGTLDRIDGKVYNSACLIQPRELEQYYYKQHLVPFGEYVPLEKLLFFVNRMVDQEIGRFDQGNSTRPLVCGDINIGTTICYENIFPDLVRRFALNGAEILCNITNDAWFGRSAASRQHFSAGVFRAVENRRPMLRSANTGISGAVDTKGRILYMSRLFEQDAVVVAVRTDSVLTFYSRYGDVFAIGCLIFSLASLVLSGVLNRRQHGKPEVTKGGSHAR